MVDSTIVKVNNLKKIATVILIWLGLGHQFLDISYLRWFFFRDGSKTTASWKPHKIIWTDKELNSAPEQKSAIRLKSPIILKI